VPAAVRQAFGLPVQGQALPGGEGRCFRHGPAVVKPVENAVEAEWSAQLLLTVEQHGFRLPRPLRAGDGRWVVDGWAASEYVGGETGPAGRWAQLFSASRAFHQALARAPKPSFLAARTHRWARADRVAWGEQPVEVPAEAAGLLTRLQQLVRPVSWSGQLIHGDLSGNVLFADGAPPAIIDFSPYWRPVRYAEAVAVVDGLLWFGAEPDLVSSAGPDGDFGQLLVRALIFRLVALTERARDEGQSCLTELQPFLPVVGTVEQLVANRCCS
jgi:uncharacterized protein (TIGR02569 family)